MGWAPLGWCLPKATPWEKKATFNGALTTPGGLWDCTIQYNSFYLKNMKNIPHNAYSSCEANKFGAIDLYLVETMVLHLLCSWHTQRDAFFLRYRRDFASLIGWRTGCEFAAKITSTNENPLYICGETVHAIFVAKTLGISVTNVTHWKIQVFRWIGVILGIRSVWPN